MHDSRTTLEQFSGFLHDLLQPQRKESVVKWCEENIELTTGAKTGKVSLRETPYAREPLERWGDKETRQLVLCFGAQAAKALSLDTPIPTPYGWTTVERLKVGEVVFGRDGGRCSVIYKTEVFHGRDCYRVTFGNGDSVVADAGHLWKVERSYRRWDGKRRVEFSERVEEVVETTQLRTGRCPHRIPVAMPIEADHLLLEIAPYALGVWLGDGCSGSARFWGEENDATEIMGYVLEDGYPASTINREGVRVLRIGISGGMNASLRKLGLLDNKHIPAEYLRASVSQRMRLLQGLMDTDGTCCKRGRRTSFTSTSRALADGFFELAASLGFKPVFTTGIASVDGRRCGESYRVSFHPCGREVFRLKRKQGRVKPAVREAFLGHEIVSVEKIKSVPVQCIAVSSADHTFLCGRSMVPTHNTTIIMLGMLFRICRDAQDAMWVLPNSELAKSFSKSRWVKMVKACRAAQHLLPKTGKGEVDKHLFGFTEQHFIHMVLNFIGSNSPANLSSRPVGMLVLDETDKYGDESKFEAAAIELAEERTKTYPFPLVAKASTPTLGDRMIWQEFLKSDQRYYNVPCPRCSQEVILKFTVRSEDHGDCGVRWWYDNEEEAKTDGEWDMAKVAKLAHYRCQKCGGVIKDYERGMMLENGVWRPTNPLGEPGRFGYHLSSLYSILSIQTSLSAIAVRWLTGKRTMSGRKNFINSWLAEVWDASRAFDAKEVNGESYTLSDTPGDAENIMAVDFQENHFWVVVRRFAKPDEKHPFGESWLLYADRVETEDELLEIQRENGVLGENVLCDMARKPNQVGRVIVSNEWRGVWGTDTKSFWHRQVDGTRLERLYSEVQYRDPHLGTKWANRTPERAKYVKFSKHGLLDAVNSLRHSIPAIWHTTVNANERYARHLNSRVKQMRQNVRTGKAEWFWKELHQENHLADCESHVLVRALQLGLVSIPDEIMEQTA